MVFNAPGNINKGKLIFNRFTIWDLVIATAGILISYVVVNTLFRNVEHMTAGLIVISLTPMIIGIAVVMPIGNYHNMVMFIRILYGYLTCEKRYYWEGVYKD